MVIKSKGKKSVKHKIEEIKGSYKFTYIKFNFSFLTSNNSFKTISILRIDYRCFLQ